MRDAAAATGSSPTMARASATAVGDDGVGAGETVGNAPGRAPERAECEEGRTVNATTRAASPAAPTIHTGRRTGARVRAMRTRSAANGCESRLLEIACSIHPGRWRAENHPRSGSAGSPPPARVPLGSTARGGICARSRCAAGFSSRIGRAGARSKSRSASSWLKLSGRSPALLASSH